MLLPHCPKQVCMYASFIGGPGHLPDTMAHCILKPGQHINAFPACRTGPSLEISRETCALPQVLASLGERCVSRVVFKVMCCVQLERSDSKLGGFEFWRWADVGFKPESLLGDGLIPNSSGCGFELTCHAGFGCLGFGEAVSPKQEQKNPRQWQRFSPLPQGSMQANI